MRITRLIAVLFVTAALPRLAAADTVRVTSSSQYLRFPDFQSDTDQQELVQYLRLNATFGEKDRFGLQGYGRLIGQLTTSSETYNQLTDHVYGRLYYLFFDARDLLPGHLDARVGRTFVPSTAIPGIVDGGQLLLRDLGLAGLGASAFGGKRVFLDDKSELAFHDDWLMGAALSLDTVALTRVEASWARDYRRGRLARDLAALDLSTTPTAMVSVTGRAAYDLVTSTAAELQAGLKVSPVAGLALRGEYYSSVPSFDRDSFYRYFDVSRYQAATFGAEYRFGALGRVEGSYAYERFDAGETANLFGVGARLRPLPSLSVNASYEHRSGFAGRIGGLRASAAWVVAPATISAGADYDDFRRQESRDGTAKRYWAALNVDFTKAVAAAARLERDENFLFFESYQAYLVLDVHP